MCVCECQCKRFSFYLFIFCFFHFLNDSFPALFISHPVCFLPHLWIGKSENKKTVVDFQCSTGTNWLRKTLSLLFFFFYFFFKTFGPVVSVLNVCPFFIIGDGRYSTVFTVSFEPCVNVQCSNTVSFSLFLLLMSAVAAKYRSMCLC